MVVALAVGVAVLQAPADAAKAAVTVKAVSSEVVPAGAMTTVVPRYATGKNVRVLSARVDVKRGSTWVARGVRRVKVPAGTYRVTTKVSYRQRVGGKLSRKRLKTHRYTLRLTPAAAIAPTTPVSAPVTSYVPTPVVTPPAPITTPTPTASTSLARTSTSCYDVALVKADGTPWRCTFSDGFSGTTLDRSRWTPVETRTSGYQIGRDCFVDDPGNISVGSGALSLTVRKLDTAQPCPGARKGDEYLDHTAGSVILNDAFAQSRGRFEIRAAFPATTVAGHHGALWMFPKAPTASWPLSGEIDIAEYYSRWHGRAIPYIHYGSTDPSVTNNYCFIADPTAFNTYTLEWTDTTMSIAYNGRTCLTHEISDDLKLPFEGQFKMLLTQGLGVGDGPDGNTPTDTTPDVGTTKVDYVRIWK